MNANPPPSKSSYGYTFNVNACGEDPQNGVLSI
jgi:hypothetical protein